MGSRDPYSHAQYSLGFTGTWVGIACSYANVVRRIKLNTERSIEFQLRCSASEALQRIIEATAREGLPYMEPMRPRDREFLSRVSGTKFRIWKWSARRRGRGNEMVPILRGEVKDGEHGSELSAVFVLHPFSKIGPPIMTLVFLGIAVTVWLQAKGLLDRLLAGLFMVFGGLLAFRLFTGRGRERAEMQITQFANRLFRDVLVTRYTPVQKFESNTYEE